MKSNYTLYSLRKLCKQKFKIIKLLEKLTETSSLLGLVDYFRIFKALIILFLLFACMNYIPNQNGKVLEETLADFIRLRRLPYFRPSITSSLNISQHSSVTFPHAIESIMNGSLGVKSKLVNYQFRGLG